VTHGAPATSIVVVPVVIVVVPVIVIVIVPVVVIVIVIVVIVPVVIVSVIIVVVVPVLVFVAVIVELGLSVTLFALSIIYLTHAQGGVADVNRLSGADGPALAVLTINRHDTVEYNHLFAHVRLDLDKKVGASDTEFGARGLHLEALRAGKLLDYRSKRATFDAKSGAPTEPPGEGFEVHGRVAVHTDHCGDWRELELCGGGCRRDESAEGDIHADEDRPHGVANLVLNRDCGRIRGIREARASHFPSAPSRRAGSKYKN